ncbi:MAG: hypothetical protein JNL16_07130 [Dechloromonas sp.]|nr:hypothetical protein [Dechloromonas sp.]
MPTNLLDWPRVSGLLPEIKLILGMGFWAGRYTNSIGIAEVPLRPLAATLGLDPAALETGIKTLCGEGLLVGDFDRLEYFVADWFRFHTFRGNGIQIAKKEFLKIGSITLSSALLKAAPWLGDEPIPGKEERSISKKQRLKSPTAAATPTSSAAEKTRIRRQSGIVTFIATDPERAIQLERIYQPEQIANAVKAVEAKNREPVPGLVQKEIERQIALEVRKTKLAADDVRKNEQIKPLGDAKAGLASAKAVLSGSTKQGTSLSNLKH